MEALVVDIKKPLFECVEIERHPLQKNAEENHFIPSGIDVDTSLTTVGIDADFFSTRKELNESVTNPSSKTFFHSRLAEFSKIYSDLKFDNKSVVISTLEILNICAKNRKFNVSISKTDDDEILIYSKNNNQYRNLVIDNDGDIQYILIGSKLGEEKSTVFSHEKGLDYYKLASLI